MNRTLEVLRETCKQLANVVVYLKKYEEHEFASKLGELSDRGLDILKEGNGVDRQKVQSLLIDIGNLFGGMGSLNDLCLWEGGGHRLRQNEEKEVNRKLDVMTDRLFELYESLKEQFQP